MAATTGLQPCGGTTGYGCGKPVPPGPGRRAGRTWWHTNRPACKRASVCARAAIARQRRARADPRPTGICTICQGPYTGPTRQGERRGCCSRRACTTEMWRLQAKARQRALRDLARAHPEEFRDLFRVAQVVALVERDVLAVATGGAHE